MVVAVRPPRHGWGIASCLELGQIWKCMARWGFVQTGPPSLLFLSKVISNLSSDMMMKQMACVGECKCPSPTKGQRCTYDL